MSKNKSKKEKGALVHLEERNITELTESVWKQLVGLIEQEVEKPDERSVWPRKMSLLTSNGRNQLVAGKIEVQKFTDVRNSSKELGKFFGSKAGFSTVEITEENGEMHSMSLEHDPIIYIDFGEMLSEEGLKSAKGVIKA